MLADTFGAEGVGPSMGYVTTALSLGNFIGPVLGGLVFDRAGYLPTFGMQFALIGVDMCFRLLLIEVRKARKWTDDGTADVGTADDSELDDEEGTRQREEQDPDGETQLTDGTLAYHDIDERDYAQSERRRPLSPCKTQSEPTGSSIEIHAQEDQEAAAHEEDLQHHQQQQQDKDKRRPSHDSAASVNNINTETCPSSSPQKGKVYPITQVFPATDTLSILQQTPSKIKSVVPPIFLLLRSRRLLTALYSAFSICVTVTVFDATIPLQVRQAFSWTALDAGLTYFPFMMPMLVGPLFGLVYQKYGPRWLVTLSFWLLAASTTLLMFTDKNTIAAKVGFCILLFAIGVGLAMGTVPFMAEIAESVAEQESKSQGRLDRAHSGPDIESRVEEGDGFDHDAYSTRSGGNARSVNPSVATSGNAASKSYGQAYSLFMLAWAAGTLVGPLWGGLIREHYGWSATCWSLGILNFVSFVPNILWLGGDFGNEPLGVALKAFFSGHGLKAARSRWRAQRAARNNGRVHVHEDAAVGEVVDACEPQAQAQEQNQQDTKTPKQISGDSSGSKTTSRAPSIREDGGNITRPCTPPRNIVPHVDIPVVPLRVG